MDVTKGNTQLLKEYYGDIPSTIIRSLVAVENGKPLGVAGIKRQNEYMVMFSDFSDELREHKEFKKTMVKGYRELMKMKPKMPVFSSADPGIEGSQEFLTHIGFKQVGEIWVV